MKILITNNHLSSFAGSELFTFNLAKELKNKGHEVFVFSFELGEVANKIKECDISVTNNLLNYEKEKFDIIHAQHNTTAIAVRSIFPQTPIIFMVHGVLPELEQVPSVDLGIAKFIVVSEEIQEHLVSKKAVNEGNILILRNFVDFNRFKSKKPVNKKIKKLLVLSNHYTDEVKYIIETACKNLDIKVFHVGLPENPVENVEDYINNADLVVTLGRGAIEAMACERNVIVYDVHGGDGFVDENNFYEIRKNNFSGRRYGIRYSVNAFEKELMKYDPNLGKKLRDVVLKENSKDKIVDELEGIYLSAKNDIVKFDQDKYWDIFYLTKVLFTANLGKNIEINSLNHTIQQKDKELKRLDQIIKQQQGISTKEVDKLKQTIQEKDQEIIFMRSSKFWKLRKIYFKIKFVIFYPLNFIKKYLKFKNYEKKQ